MRTHEIVIREPSYFGRVYVVSDIGGLAVILESGVDGIGELDCDGQTMNGPIPIKDAIELIQPMIKGGTSSWQREQAAYLVRRLSRLGPALLRHLRGTELPPRRSPNWKRGYEAGLEDGRIECWREQVDPQLGLELPYSEAR